MKHLIGMFILSLSVAAQAQSLKTIEAQLGPISSGGGMGVVCYNPDDTVKSVELLDLWEARKLYQREIIPSDKSVREQVLAGLENLKHSIDPAKFKIVIPDFSIVEGWDVIFNRLESNANRFLSEKSDGGIRRLRGVELSLTDDAYEVIRPIDCKVKQVVRYIDNGKRGDVIINQDLLDKMDNLNLAALYLHEVFYALLRKAGEQSSIRIRRAIGLIFSGHIFKPWNTFLSDDHVVCEGKLNKVYVYPDKNYTDRYGRLLMTAKASIIDGRHMIGEERITLSTVVTNMKKVFDQKTNWSSVMGSLTGNDFSYSSKTMLSETGEMEAFVKLESSPDLKDDDNVERVTCKKVSKQHLTQKPR